MEPLVETWVPDGPGVIHAHFTASCTTKEGNRVIAEAVTDYHLESGETLQARHHRFATFKTTIDGNKMAKYQHVTLYKEFPGHDEGKVPSLDFQTLGDIDRVVEAQAAQLRRN